MAQSIEINEEITNGLTHATPVVKSLNTFYIKGTQANASKCDIEMMGRNTKDYRTVSESNSAVLALANAAPTTDISTLFAADVTQFPGGLELGTVVERNFSKDAVVEFYADPQNAANTIVIEAEETNTIERRVYVVAASYASIKAFWLL
tara:strand:+ start:181 stop:627 length:447 start_codon:yes stop_codon:yes gene_type:complete